MDRAGLKPATSARTFPEGCDLHGVLFVRTPGPYTPISQTSRGAGTEDDEATSFLLVYGEGVEPPLRSFPPFHRGIAFVVRYIASWCTHLWSIPSIPAHSTKQDWV